MALKVAYVVEYPTPYDVPLFERIARRPEIDFTALFLSEVIGQRKWRVEPAGKFPYKTVPGRSWFVSQNTQFAVFWNPRIFREILKDGYEVVGASGYIPLTHYSVLRWCKRKGIPYFLRSEAILPDKRSLSRRLAKRMMLKPVIKNADAWFAAGSLARDYLVHYGAEAEKVFFLNYTIDDDFFSTKAGEARMKRNEIRKELGIKSGCVILFSGRLAPMKGLDVLFDAFSSIKRKGLDAALLLLGTGPLEEGLRRRTEQEGLEDVHFAGFHQPEELPRFYGVSDVLVLPSIYEPWGIVVNEALACGLPVIASDVTGAAGDLVIPGETGYRFKTGNSRELAEALEKLIANSELRREMGTKGREVVKNWGYQRSVDGFVKAALAAAGKMQEEK